CKFWSKFPTFNISIAKLQEYYKHVTGNSPKLLIKTTLEDQNFINRLQGCTSPEEMQSIINEIKNSPSSSKKSISEDIIPENNKLFRDSQDPYEDIEL
ncbi:hypothetical protein R6Q57_029071, partial [Mikania cordata]